MAVLKVHNGTSFITAIGKTYNGAAWEDQMNFHNGSDFIELYPTTLTVTASGNNISNIRFNAACYAGCTFKSEENEYNNQGAPDDATHDATFIVKYINGGNSSQVWVQRVIVSGTLNDEDPGSSRLVCSTDRRFGIVRASAGTHACVITLNFYDAASGGSLLQTVSVNLDAEFTV